jgi:hypothetical protein
MTVFYCLNTLGVVQPVQKTSALQLFLSRPIYMFALSSFLSFIYVATVGDSLYSDRILVTAEDNSSFPAYASKGRIYFEFLSPPPPYAGNESIVIMIRLFSRPNCYHDPIIVTIQFLQRSNCFTIPLLLQCYNYHVSVTFPTSLS